MILNKLNLNGEWKLYYYPHGEKTVNTPSELDGISSVKATVPGNVEISLAEAGVISKDLFKGMTTAENERFEKYHWWYKKEFETDFADGERIMLRLGAVDCFAEYYLNGNKIGESENAFVPVEFDISDYVNSRGNNTLFVHIKPCFLYLDSMEFSQYQSVFRPGYQTHIRKPAHSFGWDIFPRAVSAGIWKDAEIYTCDEYNIKDFGYWVRTADEDEAEITFHAVVDIPDGDYTKDVKVNISAKCDKSEINTVLDLKHFKSGFETVILKTPKLWWPYGYGEANIYDLEYTLVVDGKVADRGSMTMGVRTVELKRTETMLEKDHCFKFVINGIDIMCKGSNWVPLDAYHSRDKERYTKAMRLFTDTHCNIIRVWGGGVYEQDEFYDYCDRHGIMIWQDFMMACFSYSLEEKYLQNIKKEAEYVVKSLRHHPSIVLWAGDNEIDEGAAWQSLTPAVNKINRQILPEVVAFNDVTRPYMASSPYINENYYKEYPNNDIFPERHLWGARDYFKASFYKDSKAHFVSETGYHGCPCRSTVEKTVDADSVWPIYNEQWSLHSSDQCGSMHRVKLMEQQIEQLFGFKPDNLDDFILASQISQAEAKKYFIERIRIKKPYTSGVIWWNMLDGWPQMSDAVVDYFFEKKLAYEYIKKSQEPCVLMIDEMADWNYTLVASNDTLQDKSGTYKIYDIDGGEILAEDTFNVCANSNKKLAQIPLLYSDKKFLVIEWEVSGKKYINHYLCGMPGFDFETYKRWLDKYRSLK